MSIFGNKFKSIVVVTKGYCALEVRMPMKREKVAVVTVVLDSNNVYRTKSS